MKIAILVILLLITDIITLALCKASKKETELKRPDFIKIRSKKN